MSIGVNFSVIADLQIDEVLILHIFIWNRHTVFCHSSNLNEKIYRKVFWDSFKQKYFVIPFFIYIYIPIYFSLLKNLWIMNAGTFFKNESIFISFVFSQFEKQQQQSLYVLPNTMRYSIIVKFFQLGENLAKVGYHSVMTILKKTSDV